MKIVTFDSIKNTERKVVCPNGGFISYRFLLKKDGMGYSFHKTFIPKGRLQKWHYKYHLESCYCVSGKGRITDLKTMKTFLIVPDTLYALDNHDDHLFQALEDTTLLCVFNPPVVGTEVHQEDGSYKIEKEK